MAKQGKNGQKIQTRKFSIKMQKKLVVLFGLVLLAFAGLSVRLVWITKEDGTAYQKQVLSQQRYDSTTLPFRRGDIVDAKGTKLAVSEKVYNLVIDSKLMLDKDGKYLESSLQALAANFPSLDMTEVRNYVTTHPNSSWYVPLRRLSYEEIAGFQEAQVEDATIKGVWFEEEYKRVYPNGSLAADVIGFARSDNQGQYGLEEYYNDVLNGTAGREYGYLNDDSTLKRTIKPAVDGNIIHSTIDANIQSIVEKYLKQFNEEHKDSVHPGNGAENLGCIIMEVNTGNVLAMASYPTFDLNQPKNTDALLGSRLIEQITNVSGYQVNQKTDTYITQETIDSLDEDQLLLNLNQLWKNYTISSTYEPGSTAKPFTVAAALENGTITGNEHYQCNGSLEVGGHTIKCHSYRSGGEGDVSVQDSIAWSCNVALMKIAASLGADEFSVFQHVFNFGLKTNIDLAGEARTASLLYTADEMGAADLATNSFGQNFNVTMIQMISGFCSLINGGYYYEPHVVDKITNTSGATVQNIEPRVLKQTISESTSEKIRQYCRAVVMEEGGDRRTGKTARPAGYAIGGKTGTAQTLPRGNGEYVVSFIGYAPADDPQIAIYVVVDRANATPQDDAKYATGIVRNILTEVLPYLNIFMTEELSEKEIQELQEKQLAITNQYTQKPEDEALENVDQPTGEGTDQNPAEGSDTAGDAAEGTPATNGDGENTDGETTDNTPTWMTYPIDPATGYRVNPETGEQFYADTGDPVSGNQELIDADTPANPALQNPDGQE